MAPLFFPKMPTEDQLAEYKEAFALYDKKGSGSVEPSVLGDLLRACGQFYFSNPTNAQINELVSSLKGPVSFDSFVNDIIPKGFKPSATVEEFVQGFQVFDKDGNGFISSGELRYVLTSLGEKLSEEEVDELLRGIEVDKNGFINYETFVKTILSG